MMPDLEIEHSDAVMLDGWFLPAGVWIVPLLELRG